MLVRSVAACRARRTATSRVGPGAPIEICSLLVWPCTGKASMTPPPAVTVTSSYGAMLRATCGLAGLEGADAGAGLRERS